MNIAIYDQSGKVVENLEVSPEVFEVDFNGDLVHQVAIWQAACARSATAKVKTKGEVSGGGKKPYAQKHTGRARAGSIRSPLWRGGGIIFGPTGRENHTFDINRKARRKALFMVLSDKVRNEKVIGLTEFTSENGKTKDVKKMLGVLPCGRNILVVLDTNDELLARSIANLPNVKSILVSYLNVHDILKYETVLFMKSALLKVQEIFKSKVKV